MKNYTFVLSLILIALTFSVVKAQCISINQLISAYGFNSIYNFTNGSGTSITIVDAYGLNKSVFSLNSFFKENNISQLTNSTISVFYPFGLPTSFNASWAAETAIDIEIAHSLAPGAHINLVIAPNASYYLYQALNWSIYNLNTRIISISWGSPESGYSAYDLNYLNSILRNAYEKGISIIVGSGDSGAYVNNVLTVNFPAGSQYVLSVGGTKLIEQNGIYESEVGWNGSGGGISQLKALSFEPNYNGNVTVPDVSFNAGTSVCLFNGISSGAYIGTSLAAPAWAALTSLLYSYNPNLPPILHLVFLLYHNFGYEAFHPIYSGCNNYYCANGSYNLVTGIGSPKLPQFFYFAVKHNVSINLLAPGFTFEINGVNYSSPSSLNFNYYSNLTVKVFSFNKSGIEYIPQGVIINGKIYPIEFNLITNQSYNISVEYTVKYRVEILNYRPGYNFTIYLSPGNYNISIGNYLLYYNNSFHQSQIYLEFNNSLRNVKAFYNPISNLVFSLSSPVNFSIEWNLSNTSLITSNFNCISIYYKGETFNITNNSLFIHSYPLYVKPCILFTSNKVYYFDPFVSNSNFIHVIYDFSPLTHLSILSLSNNTLNATLSFSLYNYSFNSSSYVPLNSTPLYVYFKGYRLKVYSYSLNKNGSLIYAPIINLQILEQGLYPFNVKYNGKISFANKTIYFEGNNNINISNVIIPYNLTIDLAGKIFEFKNYSSSKVFISIAQEQFNTLTIDVFIIFIISLIIIAFVKYFEIRKKRNMKKA
ncbi:MAG: S53 family peptidase [Candidatus Parvarchaeota archaeon]|nr:S53 family peptidase [Candidatus Rehaiarchaeum fermentans]